MEDKTLLDLIGEDPDKGIQQAMNQYGKAVNTICRSILKSASDGTIDEAVSDTFFKLWKNCNSYQEIKGKSLKSYVYSIARNTAIDIWRKEQQQSVVVNEEAWFNLESGYSVETQVQEKELQNMVQQLIKQLGEPDHTIFLLKYFLGMGNQQIASQLQIETKKVENILYRGKSRLKKMLGERGIQSYEER